MRRATRLIPVAALLAALGLASGCATKPPTPEERAAVWLAEAPRRLAVHVDRELPPPDLRSRDHKVGERVGTGAVTGAGAAAYGIVDFCVGGGPLGCIVGVAVSPVMFVAGAVYGAASVDSVDSYHPIESAKGAAALFAPTHNPIDLPGLLEESVVAKVNASSRHAVYPERRAGQGGAPPDLDGKLELSFRAFELFGDAGDDPSVALVLRVSADLSTPQGAPLGLGDFTYQSPMRYVSGWKADDARLFRDETGKAVRDIAARIADKLNSSPSIMAKLRVSNAGSRDTAWTTAIAREASVPAGPLALAAPQSAASESSAPAGLLASGTEWTYELSDGIYGGERSRVRVKVTDAHDDFVYEKVSAIKGPRLPPPVSRAIDAREARFDLYRLDADRALTEFAPYLFAAGGEKALKSVADAKGYPTAGFSDWVARSAPPVWEEVTVPAGTFRALRFAIYGHRQISPFSPIAVYRFEIDVWYSPEVKRYVRLEHKTWLSERRPNGDDVVELVEYRPPF